MAYDAENGLGRPTLGSLFNLNPFALMRQFSEDMDQMFGSNFGGVAAMEIWRPAVEIKQKDLMVTAERQV